MKLVVDKMPANPDDCIFCKHEYETWNKFMKQPICFFSNRKCDLPNKDGTCSYLRRIKRTHSGYIIYSD